MLIEKPKAGALALVLVSTMSWVAVSARWLQSAPLLILLAAAVLIAGSLSRESRGKPTLWYAGVIVLACLAMFGNKMGWRELYDGVHRFAPVMLLLVGIAHFRHSVTRSGLSLLISRHLLAPDAGWRNSLRVSAVTAALSVLSGQGSIAIVCTALSQNVRNRLNIPKLTNRAMVSTMFVLPTTIASASVASAIPHLDNGAVAWFGIPLALWALTGSIVPRLDAHPAVTVQAETGERSSPLALAIFFGVCCTALYWWTRQMTLAFAGTMLLGYLFEMLSFRKPGRMRLLRRESAASLDAIAPELCLLAASGLLIFTMEKLALLSHLPGSLLLFFSNIYVVLFVLIFLLPLITVVGLHPLILFGVLFSLMKPAAFEHNHLRYLAWCTMFVMANLLSPVSISSIVAATSIAARTDETSYRAHWKFCLGLMAFAYLYLAWLAG